MKRLLLLVFPVVIVLGMSAGASFAGPGACCLVDGSCVEGTEEVCSEAHGTYQGDDTYCTSTECPSVEITDVSVDRETDPSYYQGEPITYSIQYTVNAVPGNTYDVKAIVKPRFGRECRRKPPGVGVKGRAKGKAFDVGDGDHEIIVDYRPNNPEKHYIIPKCAKTGWRKVKYLVKLYNADTNELVARDTLLEAGQIYVESLGGGGGGGGGHHSLPSYYCIDCHVSGYVVRDCQICH